MVADHAVGGVDRLVGRRARQAAEGHPERRRDDPVGEVLRQALDRGAGDAGRVEALRVAADDVRDRRPARVEAAGLERRRHRRHVRGEAALGEEGAAGERGDQEPGAAAERPLQQPGRDSGRGKDHGERERARRASGGRAPGFPVQAAVEGRDQRADPAHRVADAAIEPVGIAEGELEQQREGGEGDAHAPGVSSAARPAVKGVRGGSAVRRRRG